MIALIQRVSRASVRVADEEVGAIGRGLLSFIGVEKTDAKPNAERLAERILGYRVFADARGRMNLSLADTDGGLLLVPQFTLAADTDRGMRPSFSSAAAPDLATALFEYLVACARQHHRRVATGRFGAEMMVSLENHGPVTLWLTA